MTIPWLEVAANALYAWSVWLAGRNSVHTWWTGIAGCLLFTRVFGEARLYADVTLMAFYVVTSLFGWWAWLRGARGAPLPIRRSSTRFLLAAGTLAVAGALGYGALLWQFTAAFAPFVDSAVLAFSVLGQFTLMARRVESWWCWLTVNTIAVPLYWARDLHLTAVLYAAFWINAVVALRQWQRQAAR